MRGKPADRCRVRTVETEMASGEWTGDDVSRLPVVVLVSRRTAGVGVSAFFARRAARWRPATPRRWRSTRRGRCSGCGLGALLLVRSLLIGLACASKEKDRDLAILLVLGAGLFLAWKAGCRSCRPLVICDTLFAFLLFVGPAAWAVFHPPARHRRLLLGMTLIALVSPYVLLLFVQPGGPSGVASAARLHDSSVNVTVIVHPSDFRAALDGDAVTDQTGKRPARNEAPDRSGVGRCIRP